MSVIINSESDFEKFIIKNYACVLYFSRPTCNVCLALKPKIEKLLNSQFPEMKLVYINVEKNKALSAQKHIFSVPTILIYFERKELLRFSRNISVSELSSKIKRPYNLAFGQQDFPKKKGLTFDNK